MKRFLCTALCLALLLTGCGGLTGPRLTSEVPDALAWTATFGAVFSYGGLPKDQKLVLKVESWRNGSLYTETTLWACSPPAAQFAVYGDIRSGHMVWTIGGASWDDTGFETGSGPCFWSVQLLDQPGTAPEDGMVLAGIMHMDGNAIRPFTCADLTEETIAQYDDAALLRLHIEPA